MKKVLLKAENVCRDYERDGKKIRILNNISTELFEGDFTVIMGRRGRENPHFCMR